MRSGIAGVAPACTSYDQTTAPGGSPAADAPDGADAAHPADALAFEAAVAGGVVRERGEAVHASAATADARAMQTRPGDACNRRPGIPYVRAAPRGDDGERKRR
jgi:hypothetical protein